MSDFETVMQPFTCHIGRQPDGDGPIPVVIRIARRSETPNAFVSRRGGHVRATLADAHQADRVLAATEAEKAADRAYYKAGQLIRDGRDAAALMGSAPVFSEDHEIHLDFEEHLEDCGYEAGDRPAFVYEAQEEDFDYDAVDALESWLLDNAFEDAVDHLVDFDEFVAFWTAWKAKQTITWWSATRRIRIVDAEAFARRLAEAEKIVAKGRPNIDPPTEIAFADDEVAS